jgi:hypothetical protein
MSVEYHHRALIIAPETFSALSSNIAQAIGPSPEDNLSFGLRAEKDGIDYGVCDVAITAETHAGYQAMLSNPAILHGAVLQGWERKAMEGSPPTLSEITSWLDAVVIYLGPAWILTQKPVDDILEELGYKRVLPPSPAFPV